MAKVKGKRFAMVPLDIIEAEQMKAPGLIKSIAYYAANVGAENVCWHSTGECAKRMHTRRATVRCRRDELEFLGLIEVDRDGPRAIPRVSLTSRYRDGLAEEMPSMDELEMFRQNGRKVDDKRPRAKSVHGRKASRDGAINVHKVDDKRPPSHYKELPDTPNTPERDARTPAKSDSADDYSRRLSDFLDVGNPISASLARHVMMSFAPTEMLVVKQTLRELNTPELQKAFWEHLSAHQISKRKKGVDIVRTRHFKSDWVASMNAVLESQIVAAPKVSPVTLLTDEDRKEFYRRKRIVVNIETVPEQMAAESKLWEWVDSRVEAQP